MRFINKQNEPASFSAWKALENEDWTPTYSDFRGPIKKEVHHALMEEQGYLCCYCEQGVDFNHSHIEHLKSQSDYPELALSYDNMLCSCGRANTDKPMPDHCGNAKGSSRISVTPLQSDCASRFAYESDGIMKAAFETDRDATETIQILKLYTHELKESRSKALEEYLRHEDDYKEIIEILPHVSFIKSVLGIE